MMMDQGLVMTEQTFMQRAVALSLEKMRANRGGPFGAVIVRNGTIISEGWNEVTSSNDPTAHSEIVAIRRACTVLGNFNLPDCDIYTSCEPCPMCLGAIYWARLWRVYFANTRIDASKIGFDDDFIYREVAQVPELRRIPHFRLMTEDAQVAFKEWTASPEKIRY
jgi:guanine deaminase